VAGKKTYAIKMRIDAIKMRKEETHRETKTNNAIKMRIDAIEMRKKELLEISDY
jgi:hypothetical protein